MNRCAKLLTGIIAVAFLGPAPAQIPRSVPGAVTSPGPVDSDNISLEELMNIQVDTAANFSSSWRAQPGIITVFTSDDIQAMGARTLRDILLHIPGVSLGMDNHNAVGLMMRGNWTLEGKIQYLVNDLPVNDLIYGTFPLPPYLPADQFDRIEILRGPGSVKYGDSAQLAVIRIYTRGSAGDARVSVTGFNQSSANSGILSFTNRFNFAAGSLALAGSVNQGHWGAGTWIDDQGTAADVATIGTTGANLAAELEWQGTHVQLYYNDYAMDSVQQFGTYAPTSTVRYRQTNLAIARDFSPGAGWSLRPRLSYRDESDWREKSLPPDFAFVYDVRATRLDGRIDATNQYSPEASVSLGFYHQLQTARAVDVGVPPAAYYPPSGKLEYHASAFYGNWDVKLHDFALAVGARASRHEYAGSSFTPRFGLTRSTRNWHAKWLYGRAFREPNLELINPNNHPGQARLKPELTTVHELEIGHTLTDRSYLTLSLFDQRIKDSIIYTFPAGFSNNVPSKTRGAEVQYWYRGETVTIQANYSRSHANDDDLTLYDVTGRSGQFLGAARQIANLWLSWRTPVRNLSLQVDTRYLGSRTAYAYSPTAAGLTQQVLPSESTLNLGLRYKIRSMTVSLGLHNVGNVKQYIPQPYSNGGSTPFPVDGREFWLRAEWSLAP